jgi:PAS domain-containing protein
MNRLAVQFLDQGFHRMLFDAMPMPVFVVDEDACVLECNTAAARLLHKSKQTLVGKRCGEVLNCIHARETAGGCGYSPDCSKCVVRQSVRAAAQGRNVIRHETEMTFGKNGNSTRAKLRVTCQSFSYERRTFILLILEGFNGCP